MADALGVTSGSTKFAKKGRRAERMVKEKDDPILNEFSLRKANDMKVGVFVFHVNKTTDFPECKVGGWNEGEISHSVSFGRRAEEDSLDVCKALRKEGKIIL
ncbi:unnamed protein product [Schistosoma rodhaini]|nr:unnamed protein product [Schistosoma rodhaini]